MGLGWYATLAVVIASGQGVDSFASCKNFSDMTMLH